MKKQNQKFGKRYHGFVQVWVNSEYVDTVPFCREGQEVLLEIVRYVNGYEIHRLAHYAQRHMVRFVTPKGESFWPNDAWTCWSVENGWVCMDTAKQVLIDHINAERNAQMRAKRDAKKSA